MRVLAHNNLTAVRLLLTFFRGEPGAKIQVYLLEQGFFEHVHLVFIGKSYVGGFCQ